MGAAEIAANAVGQSEIATNGVASAEIADNSVTSADITNGTITGSDIATNSIFDVDLADEPGVAQVTNRTSVTISADVATVVNTRIINCPTSGFVLAIASFELSFSHTAGFSDTYTAWLSQTTAFPSGQQKTIVWSSAMPTGIVRTIVSVNHIFSVGAGNQTVNLVADKGVGDPNYTIDDRTLSLVFIPTAYGTVSNPPLPPGENELLSSDSR